MDFKNDEVAAEHYKRSDRALSAVWDTESCIPLVGIILRTEGNDFNCRLCDIISSACSRTNDYEEIAKAFVYTFMYYPERYTEVVSTFLNYRDVMPAEDKHSAAMVPGIVLGHFRVAKQFRHYSTWTDKEYGDIYNEFMEKFPKLIAGYMGGNFPCPDEESITPQYEQALSKSIKDFVGDILVGDNFGEGGKMILNSIFSYYDRDYNSKNYDSSKLGQLIYDQLTHKLKNRLNHNEFARIVSGKYQTPANLTGIKK